MDARILLKNYIDEEKIPYTEISVAAGINLNTLKSGLYNQKMSFEKFCKVAVVTDFDIDRNITNIADTYKMSCTECLEKVAVYQESMATRTIRKRIESYLEEGDQDTSFAVVCKIQKAAETAAKKKAEKAKEQVTIPVPEELPALAEAVINHEDNTNKESVEEPMEEKANEQKVEASTKLDKLDIVRDIVREMKGMQAVEMASVVQAIINYRDDQDVNHLHEALQFLYILIKEHENGLQ